MSKWLWVFSFLFFLYYVQSYGNESDGGVLFTHDKSEILSRKKRFLVFPEGSSFQLVFCNTYPALIAIGDIFLWGVTAALAWELPQDPYSPFNHKADPLHRRMDSKMIKYIDDNGRIIYKRPYGIRKLIVNPAFVKRSADGQIKREKYNIDRKQIHASENNLEFADRHGFHRSTRVALYQKIEAMFYGLGSNGRECVLKTLCIVGKTQNGPQGGFLHEILRTTFTLPQTLEDGLEDYDKAFLAKESCEKLYPECSEYDSNSKMY